MHPAAQHGMWQITKLAVLDKDIGFLGMEQPKVMLNPVCCQ
jgi:hypothetical protein